MPIRRSKKYSEMELIQLLMRDLFGDVKMRGYADVDADLKYNVDDGGNLEIEFSAVIITSEDRN